MIIKAYLLQYVLPNFIKVTDLQYNVSFLDVMDSHFCPNRIGFTGTPYIEIPKGTIFIGEIGLGGQLRLAKQMPQRIQESIRLGFQRVIVPEGVSNLKIKEKSKLEIIEFNNISNAFDLVFNTK